MSFRRDVTNYLIRIEEKLGQILGDQEVYEDLIIRQERRIDNLLDRVMAKNLPEHKTYNYPNESEQEIPFDPLEDEELAGTIAEIEVSNR
jgi:hypothetical protein